MPKFAKKTFGEASDTPRKAYRVPEFMHAYRVGRSKTYDLITGKLKSVKVDSCRLIDAASADALMRGDTA